MAIDAAHDDLLDDIRSAAAGEHDEAALRVALLGALAQLGWDMALSATEAAEGVGGTASERAWPGGPLELVMRWTHGPWGEHRCPQLFRR